MGENMPERIWATPRGSGTISGVYVDMPMGDEARGEHEYVAKPAPIEGLREAIKESPMVNTGRLPDGRKSAMSGTMACEYLDKHWPVIERAMQAYLELSEGK